MKYQIVSKELQIASCSIADLTLEHAQAILKQWKEDGVRDARLGGLTLFHDAETGLVVLNRDREDYPYYLELAETYLALDKESRVSMRHDLPNYISEFNVMESCLKYRLADEMLFRARKNVIKKNNPKIVLDILIQRRDYDLVSSVYIAFKIGVMYGKHDERAKRKKGTAA